jgi:hypothetical protein
MVWVLFLFLSLDSGELAHVDEMPCDPGCGRHRWAHEMSTASGPLASLEITVTGTGASFASLQSIVVHRQTHRTTRFTPLKARIPKNPIQPLGLSLCFDQARTWDHQDLLH